MRTLVSLELSANGLAAVDTELSGVDHLAHGE